MKKIIAFLIVFALACALLVGCNDNAETESGHESVEEQSAMWVMDVLEGLLDHMNWEIDEELGRPILIHVFVY